MEDIVRDAHDKLQLLVDQKRKREEQLEERKRKMVQKEQLKRREGTILQRDQIKLRRKRDRLVKAKNKLESLLVKAEEDTMKKDIPEVALAKCFDAWAKATTICMRIKQIISQETGNVEENYLAAKESFKTTKSMITLLDAILYALRTA